MRRHERWAVAAGGVGLLALWEALVRAGHVDASLAPAPSAILAALAGLLQRPEVLTSLAVTGWEVLAAFLISVPLGLGLGFALAEVPALGALWLRYPRGLDRVGPIRPPIRARKPPRRNANTPRPARASKSGRWRAGVMAGIRRAYARMRRAVKAPARWRTD